MLLAAAGLGSMSAETVSNYTFGFNDPIDTSDSKFIVSSNWKHIVGYYMDDYGSAYTMSYSYKPTAGVEGTGCLYAPKQEAGDNWDYGPVIDCIVTPVVSGQISLKVKSDRSSSAYIKFYKINASGTAVTGNPVVNETSTSVINNSEFTEITYNVEEPQRIAICGQYVYMDDFTAESAEIEPVPSMTIVSADPSATTGTIKWNQAQDGSVTIKYSVTVKNTGNTPLVANETENYSISIVYGSSNTVLGTTQVPYDLAIGETSEAFDVTAVIQPEQISSIWTYSSSQIPMNLLNNLTGSKTTRAGSQVVKYEPKFNFKVKDRGAALSTAYTVPFGISEEAKTWVFQLLNEGNAPLTIKSFTLPEGFTTTAEIPAGEFTVEAEETMEIAITRPATVGSYKGNLVIVYLDANGEEKTYSLPMFGYTLAEGQWGNDFNNSLSSIKFGDGTIAQAGVGNDKTYLGAFDMYDQWVTCSSVDAYATAKNLYITPKMHAEVGDQVYFEAGKNGTVADTYGLKVYKSADRKNWGEPIMTVLRSDLENFLFQPYTYTAEEAGDCYLAFEVYGMKLDNIVAFQKANAPYDFEISEFSVPERIKSGEVIAATINVLKTATAESTDYTVKLYVNNEEKASVETVNMIYDAKGAKEYTGRVTLSPEVTTSYDFRMDMAFTDGTVVSSGTKTVTVTYESEFGFYTKDNHGSSYNHESLKTPINFGKTNNPGVTKNYEFYNWGSAPLSITGFTVPEGFSVSLTEATVEPLTAQYVDISMTAEEPGEYTGNIAISYLDGEGNPATFTLPISGTMLDPTKWYVTFDNGTTSGEWPAGSLHQAGVTLENHGTYLDPDMHMHSTTAINGATGRMFISPKVHSNGENIQMDLCAYNSSWLEGGVQIYVAESRDALIDVTTGNPTLIADYRGKEVDEEYILPAGTLTTYNIPIPEGDWYIGIAPYSRGRVDNIYGLTVIPQEGIDIVCAGAQLPTVAMQNVAQSATLKVFNVGSEMVNAEDYNVIVYVDGKPQSFTTTQNLPVLTDLRYPTEINVSFRYPKAGEFPVYMALESGDFRLETQPVNITFMEEVLNAEKQVGEHYTTGYEVPVNYYYNNCESVILYPAEMLGLNDGDVINRIAFHGFNKDNTPKNTEMQFFTQLVDDQTLTKPNGTDLFYADGMTLQRNDVAPVPIGGSESNLIELTVVELAHPIVYEAGKALKIHVHNYISSYINTSNCKTSTTNIQNLAYCASSDQGFGKGTWVAKNLPVMYLGLSAESAALHGIVNDREGNAVSGAVVLLTSNDGDNVQYEAVADETGAYTMNVIQSTRIYDATVEAENLAEFEDGIAVEGDLEKDFVLRPVFRIHEAATHAGGAEEAVVYLDARYAQGYNAVTLPVALDAEEIATIFGDATVLQFAGEEVSGTHAVAQFAQVTTMEAGVPYLIYLHGEQPEAQMFRTKDVAAELTATNGTELAFTPTSAQTDLAPGMFILDVDHFTPAAQIVAPATNGEIPTLPAYSAYIQGSDAIQSLSFTNDAELPVAVEAIGEREGDDVIYDLGGLRVKNPQKGIYIVNGKAYLLK